MLSQRDTDVWTTSGQRRVVVIGGGISGLAAAYKLASELKAAQAQVEVLLLEGSGKLGGTIATYNLDDTILELGPDSFITDKPYGLDLVRRLGIEHRLVQTQDENRRTFVAHNNQLYPLPDGFQMMAPTEIMPLIKSPLFTWQGKLRMLRDLITPAAPADADESLSEFTERRFGREALDRVVQPLVGGIYTSNPDKLSVKAALPRIAQLEQNYGSVIRGMMTTKRASTAKDTGARYSMFVSFDEGMGVLVHAIEKALPPGSIRTHALVSRILRAKEGSPFRIQFTDGSMLPADGVVVATSSFHAADLLAETDQTLSDSLRKIEYASSAVMNVIYRRKDIPHPMDGFGFVVPRTEKRTIIACSFTSNKWPNRAPKDKALVRVFVGGALQPDVFDLTDEQIECLMWEDMHTYLGLKGVPLLSVISRYPRSMPQYNVGHVKVVEAIEKAVGSLPGLALAGNAYHGVGIPDCIHSGEQAAARILESLPIQSPSS